MGMDTRHTREYLGRSQPNGRTRESDACCNVGELGAGWTAAGTTPWTPRDAHTMVLGELAPLSFANGVWEVVCANNKRTARRHVRTHMRRVRRSHERSFMRCMAGDAARTWARTRD